MVSFIRRVFSFGDKPVEKDAPQVPQDAPETVADAAVQAELEPKSRDEDLPVAADPVAKVEIETAGGPSADVVEDKPAETVEEELAAILPGVEETSDLGVVPLSLLEAEAAAESVPVEGADLPPSALPGISPSGGEIEDVPVSAQSSDSVTDEENSAPAALTPAVEQEGSPLPISPLEGEMSGRTEGGGFRNRRPAQRFLHRKAGS